MLIIILIYGILLLLSIIFHSYQKTFLKTLSKKEYHLLFLFPLSLMIADMLCAVLPSRDKKRKEQLKALYVFEDSEAKGRALKAQIIAYVIGAVLMINTFALAMTLNNTSSNEQHTVNRPGYGESSDQKSYQVVVEGKDYYLEDSIQYEVAPQIYTKEAFAKAVQKAQAYLETTVLGENTDPNRISKPLNLVTSIPALGLEVSWIRDNEELVQYDGSISNKEIKDSQSTTLTACLKSGDFEDEITLSFIIQPYLMDEQEKILTQISKAINKVDETHSNDSEFQLPEQVDDASVHFMTEPENQFTTILVLGILVIILIPLLMEKKLKEKLEEREDELRMDYPEVVNKLVLLLEAGMTVTRAWGKIATEYEEERRTNKRGKRYAYEEMVASYYELRNGISESQVYDNFGRRIKLTPYMKLSSLLAQNCSKGMEGLLQYMKTESVEAFAERKELAKRMGEKAGTKMLLPMGMMLGVVLVVIVIPAFTIM